MNIELNTFLSIDQITYIQRHISAIKEIERACHHTIPLKHVPMMILVYMLTNLSLRLNEFTQKGDIHT